MMEPGKCYPRVLIRCGWPEKQHPGPRLYFFGSPGTHQSAWHEGRFILVRVAQGCQSKQTPLLLHTMTNDKPSHHRAALDHGHARPAAVELGGLPPSGLWSRATLHALRPSERRGAAGPRGTRRAGLPAKAEHSVGMCVSTSTRP